MRPRALLTLLYVALVLVAGASSVAHATESLAQPAGDAEEESETEEGTGGAGQDDPEAETGGGEGSSEPAAQESGPPWTYQMARIALVLLLFLGLSVGLMYWRLIVSRQRGTA